MQYLFNQDFQDFLACFAQKEVEYVLVGGYAVIIHGYSRTTGDLDVLVNQTKENFSRIQAAFQQFGMPMFDMTLDKFMDSQNYNVFEYGRPPVAIDIITQIKGVSFEEVYHSAIDRVISGHLTVKVIGLEQLIKAKAAAGRPKDMNDLEHLNG